MRLNPGPNGLTVYYHTFDRTPKEVWNYEDNFNAFEFVRWKLELAGKDAARSVRAE